MTQAVFYSIAIVLILLLLLASYWWHQKYLPPVSEDVIYTMDLAHRYLFWAILCIIFYGVIAFTVNLIIKEMDLWLVLFLMSYLFMLGAIYFCIYVIFWRCVIRIDSLTFYIPLLPPKEIKFHEITLVKYVDNETPLHTPNEKVLVGYHKHKKLFFIEENTKGFPLLYDLLLQYKKIERIPVVEEFAVTCPRSDVMRGVFSFLGFAILTVLALWKHVELELPYFMILIAMTLLFLFEMLRVLLWKITVDYQTISIRNSFGITRTYALHEITRIEERGSYILLYSAKKKLAKIAKDSTHFPYLMERFQREDVLIQRILK